MDKKNDEIRILANSLGLTKSQFKDVIFQKNMDFSKDIINIRLNKLFTKKSGDIKIQANYLNLKSGVYLKKEIIIVLIL